MKLPLIIGEVGLGIAGISALVSYEVKATDLKNPVIEIENLENKLKKAAEEERLRRLLEEEERKRLEDVKDQIRRLIKEIKDFFKKNFSELEDKTFLDDLRSFWISSLDDMNDSKFKSNFSLEKSKLENEEQKEKFESQYKKMKDLVLLWQNLSSKISDFKVMLRELHELFKK